MVRRVLQNLSRLFQKTKPHLREKCRPYRFDIFNACRFDEGLELVGLFYRLVHPWQIGRATTYGHVEVIVGKDESSV